jgi:hypothetical protein
VTELQADAPRYHTRAMRMNYLRTCDPLLPKVKPSALRTIYRILTDDVSAANEELGDPEVTSIYVNITMGDLANMMIFGKSQLNFL